MSHIGSSKSICMNVVILCLIGNQLIFPSYSLAFPVLSEQYTETQTVQNVPAPSPPKPSPSAIKPNDINVQSNTNATGCGKTCAIIISSVVGSL